MTARLRPAAAFLVLGMAGSVAARSYIDAVFLDLAGVARLPHLLAASALLLALLSAGYSAAIARARPARVDAAALALFALTSLGPVVAPPASAAGAFAWALVFAAVGTLANTVAWGWATSALDARTAKRALPLLGGAATAGAVLTGAAVTALAPRHGVAWLPWVAAVLYLAMAALPAAMARSSAAAPAASAGDEAASPEAQRLFRALVLYCLLEALVSAIADFQLKAAVDQAGRRDAMAVLLAQFQGAANAGLLVLQLAVVGPVLARFGINAGLFLAPIAVLAANAAAAFVPAAAAGAAPRLADALLKFSFSRSAVEVATVPLGDRARRRAKLLLRGLPGPVGGLIAGALLLVLRAGGAARPAAAAAALAAPLVVLWLVSARHVLTSYLATLRARLRIRRVGPGGAPLAHGALERVAGQQFVRAVLEGAPGEAQLAADMLVAGLAERDAERLATHADPRLRRIAWRALAAAPSPERALPVEAARAETDAGARALVLGAFARRLDDRVAGEAERWRADPEVAREATVYLGALGRLDEGELARVLRELLRRDGPRAGRLLAAAIGRGALAPADAPALLDRLAADDPGDDRGARGAELRRAQALRALAALGTPGAVDELLRRMEGADAAAAARAAGDVPAEAVAAFAGRLAAAPAATRERAARVLGVAPDLARALGDRLLDDSEPRVRGAAARAFLRLARRGLGVTPAPEAIVAALRQELALGSRLRRALERLRERGDGAARFAAGELRLQLDRCHERLFRLLALGGDARTVQAAQRRFHAHHDLRAAVVTLLEDLPSLPLRSEVIAYLDAAPGDLRAGGPEASAGDPYIDACLADDPAIARLRPRIEAMRATALFGGVAGDVLVDLAAGADESSAAPGDTVIAQGAPGDRLYVLLDGVVRFERDGHAVGQAGPGVAFGELSLVDDAPRSATVTAETPARLLRIGRDQLHAALARHPDLWLGVARSLARWIR